MTMDQRQGQQDAAYLKGADDADDAERTSEYLAARPVEAPGRSKNSLIWSLAYEY
jgi:hypothetical protein